MKYYVDNIDDESIMKIINKFIIHIYGKELTMEKDNDGYLRFFSDGPLAAYHRNLNGQLWVYDDRLLNLIKNFISVDWDEAFALISFYFSNTYNINVREAKIPSHVFPGKIDYSKFDDKNSWDENDD